MSGIKRLTLISDPTDEFPNNANKSFKVRLPERLALPGAGWHASLMSLTVPDQGQRNAVVAMDPHTKVIRFKFTQVIRWYQLGSYRRVETPTIDVVIELENIMNANQVVATGSMFWKRVMQEVHNKIMTIVAEKQKQLLVSRRDERPVVSVKKNAMPQLTWKDDTLVIHALERKDAWNTNNVAMTKFHINLDLALKFGLVVEKIGQNTTTYVIGPNLQYTLPKVTYNRHTMPTGDPFRTYYNWEGEQYVGVNYVYERFQIVTVDKVKYVKLHLMFEWQLNNLNASFEKLVGTRKRTVMVYSDLVESSVVGSGKFPLLREVQLLRTGEGESTVEPLHHQWIKVRGQQMDILEVEIASTSGPLAILPPGKTLVTIGLKQL